LTFGLVRTGVDAPRVSASGAELPTARLVSSLTHKDMGFHDHAVTIYLPAWGQLIDHDMAMGAESKGKFQMLTSYKKQRETRLQAQQLKSKLWNRLSNAPSQKLNKNIPNKKE
jgi:hypothetical protein